MTSAQSGGGAVYRGYSQAALDAQYDQRSLVPDISSYMARWREWSHEAREHYAKHHGSQALDIAYGSGDSERLDLFAADSPTGLVVFLHGGAWRMLTKEESVYPAPALIRRNVSFAAVDFAPLPNVSIEVQAKQCRASIAWLYKNAVAAGSHNMVLVGHSSGAHHAALLATTDWCEEGLPPDLVKAAMLISGIYDLEPGTA